MTIKQGTITYRTALPVAGYWTGQVVGLTTTGVHYYWDGAAWNAIGAGGGAGPMGPQGPPGEAGPQGEDGGMGVPGPQGNPGSAGAAGAAGAMGPPGLDGIDGADGDMGVRHSRRGWRGWRPRRHGPARPRRRDDRAAHDPRAAGSGGHLGRRWRGYHSRAAASLYGDLPRLIHDHRRGDLRDVQGPRMASAWPVRWQGRPHG